MKVYDGLVCNLHWRLSASFQFLFFKIKSEEGLKNDSDKQYCNESCQGRAVMLFRMKCIVALLGQLPVWDSGPFKRNC